MAALAQQQQQQQQQQPPQHEDDDDDDERFFSPSNLTPASSFQSMASGRDVDDFSPQLQGSAWMRSTSAGISARASSIGTPASGMNENASVWEGHESSSARARAKSESDANNAVEEASAPLLTAKDRDNARDGGLGEDGQISSGAPGEDEPQGGGSSFVKATLNGINILAGLYQSSRSMRSPKIGRTAQALRQSKYSDDREVQHHGLLVPQLVWIFCSC